MANPARMIREQIQARYPGASVIARGRSSITHRAGQQVIVDSVAGGSLHYQSGGEWLEIETDWQDSDLPEFTDRSDRTHFRSYTRADATRRIYPRRDVPTEYIEFGSLEYWQTTGGGRWRSLPAGVKNRAADRLTFDGANVAVSYVSETDRMKLSFVLKTAAAPTRARWPVTLTGLTLVNWSLVSVANNGVVATLPQPFMTDATGAERAVGVAYAGGYIEYNADVAGLVYPIDLDPTIDPAVNASADDASEDGDGDVTITDAGLLVGATIATLHRYTMQRFNATISAGATIDTSYVRWYFGDAGTDDAACVIAGEDSATPAAGSAGTDTYSISGRTKTTATATWDADNIVGSTAGYGNSPSLNSIIQELVDSYDYSGGAYIALLTDIYGQSAAHNSTVRSYDGNSAQAPILHVEYTEAGGATVTGAAALSGSGILTGAGLAQVLAAAGLSGSGSLTGAGLAQVFGQVALSGSGSLVGSGFGIVIGQAALSGLGSLTGSGDVFANVVFGAAALSGSGSLTGTALVVVRGAANLAGQGILSGAAMAVVRGSALLEALGQLQGAALALVMGAAELEGLGSLTASGVLPTLGDAPVERTYVIPGQSRVYLIVLEGRVYVVPEDWQRITGAD